jgi:hypothetical protein
VGKAKENVPLAIRPFIQKDNIALDPKEVEWDGMERITCLRIETRSRIF